MSDDQELRELRLKYANLRKHWVDFPTPDGGLSIDTDSAAAFLRELADYRDAEPFAAARLRDIADMLDLVAPTIKSLSAKLENLEQGRSVILPSDRAHAEAMLTVAEAFLNPPRSI
jgi:hypothetical protein